MSYSWFRVESSIAKHPKVLAFQAAIKDPNGLAYITRLQCWTHLYATSGTFSKAQIDQLEAYCEWRGKAGGLVSALKKAGLLDDTKRALQYHDWPEYQGKLVEKSNRDAENKRKRRAAPLADGAQTARAGRARGALTYETDGRTDGRTDVTDGLLTKPPSSPIVVSPPPSPVRVEKDWGLVAEKLADWMRRQRSVAGNFPGDRDVDLAALREWALAWVLKHEPTEEQLDVMREAFNGFLADGPGDRSFSLWCTENVWLDRWNAARAARAA